MAVYIQCSSCNRKLRVRTELLGKVVRCPSCRAKFTASPSAGEGGEGTAEAGSAAAGPESGLSSVQIVEEAPEDSADPTVRRPIPVPPADPSAPPRPPHEAITTRPSQEVEGPRLAPDKETAPEGTKSGQPPFETPWARVGLVLGLIGLAALLLGLAGAWWVNAGIRAAHGKRAQAEGSVPAGGPLAESAHPGADTTRFRPRSSARSPGRSRSRA
jgi:hypothetical protein